MKKSNLLKVLCVPALAVLTAGCISFYHKTEQVRSDEERMKIEFESETAGKLFHDKADAAIRKRNPEGSTQFGVPFVSFYSKTRVVSKNAAYNDELRKCDTNKDGMITDVEARIYSERHF